MSNTIDGIGPSTGGIGSGKRTASVDATAAVPSATSGATPQGRGSDTATVSTVARQLQRLGAAVDQSSGVDSAKVASIQASISSGTYQVDSQAVANALLATQNELG